jgi:hypothetical protein
MTQFSSFTQHAPASPGLSPGGDRLAIQEAWDSRTSALITLRNIIRAHRGGAYTYVYRGAVDWANFDFSKHGFVATITAAESGLFRDDRIGLPVTVGMELLKGLDSTPDGGSDPELADRLFKDAQQILSAWSQAVDTDGNSFVTRMDRRSAQSVEVMDASVKVQGLFVTCPVEV